LYQETLNSVIMSKTVDTRLLRAAAELALQWHSEETKNQVRENFAKFAKPFWMKWGGEELVDHMMGKYVNNDRLSIVEYLYNLDKRNMRLVVKYLLSKVYTLDEWSSTVAIEEED